MLSHLKIFTYCGGGIACAITCLCFAAEKEPGKSVAAGLGTHAAPIVAGAAAAFMPDAEVTVALKKMNDPRMRGILGESVAERAAMKYLNRGGSSAWHNITPRVGPQGLDHVFFRLNQNGEPKALMVGETKFGSSRLGETKDGRQMGTKWTNKRLRGLGSRYISAGREANVVCGIRSPLSARHVISVKLRDGQVVDFWRADGKDTWKFSGSKTQLREAQRLAGRYGLFLDKAGSGLISYRSRLFRVTIEGADLRLAVSDPVAGKELNGEGRLYKGVCERGMRLSAAAEREIAKDLKKKLNMSDKEALACTKKIGNQAAKDLISTNRLFKEGVRLGGSAVLLGTGLDIVVQLYSTGKIDAGRTGLTAATMAAVTASPYAIQTLRDSQWLSSVGRIAPRLGTFGRFIAKPIPLFAVADVAVNVGLALTGNGSWADVGESAIMGAAGISAYALVMSAPAWLGATAGTGAAISSLGGAAATNATLVWFGGGTLASGGGGIVGGAVVVGGFVIVVVAAAGGIVYLIHRYRNNSNLREYNKQVFAFYLEDKNWNHILGIPN